MNTLLITIAIVALVGAVIFFRARNMSQFIIINEPDENGEEKWFIKVRRGLGYRYLEQTKDLPGFANDVFELSRNQRGALDSKEAADEMIINYRMTTVNGIEVEGE